MINHYYKFINGILKISIEISMKKNRQILYQSIEKITDTKVVKKVNRM